MMLHKGQKEFLNTIVLSLLIAFPVFAALIGINYKILLPLLGSGGRASSPKYQTDVCLGQGISGKAESGFYRSDAGYFPQCVAVTRVLPATDLKDVFVYPSPYKPGSGGRFDAQYITFKNLTKEATIRIFNIAAELVSTIEKDSSDDYYEWDAENDAGEKVASGVYIYFITNSQGDRAKGKFAIIK